MQSNNQNNNQINNQNNNQEQILAGFMNSLLGGLMNGNPYITKAVSDPNKLNMNENDIISQINLVDELIKGISQVQTPVKPKTEPVVPEPPTKGTLQSELPVARVVQETPVTRKLNFDIDSGLTLNSLKDAVFSMVLLTMEKDNIDWSGKRGKGLLPNASGYNIIDASKRYYSGNRVDLIEEFVRENILKNEDSYGLFLNKLYGQLIEE